VKPLFSKFLGWDRTPVALGLVGLASLSWVYLLSMAWGMHHMEIGASMIIMPAMEHWTAWDLVLVFLMWVVMMVAMMVPAVSPVVLCFATVKRNRQARNPLVPTGIFLLGYLSVWIGFSLAATFAQWVLLSLTLVSPMMDRADNILGGCILLAAGLFQFTRLKNACLSHCRSPIGFFMTEWRDGLLGAFQMGLKHGSYCLGCCWILMGLLFVFGVMNLFWVAALSAFVLLEKTALVRLRVSRLSGALFIAWGAWLVFGLRG